VDGSRNGDDALGGRRTHTVSILRNKSLEISASRQIFNLQPHAHEHARPHLHCIDTPKYTPDKITTRQMTRPSLSHCQTLHWRKARAKQSVVTYSHYFALPTPPHTHTQIHTLHTPRRTPHARPITVHGDQPCATRSKPRVPTRERPTGAERLIWNRSAPRLHF
jgi:hypothetical protein